MDEDLINRVLRSDIPPLKSEPSRLLNPGKCRDFLYLPVVKAFVGIAITRRFISYFDMK